MVYLFINHLRSFCFLLKSSTSNCFLIFVVFLCKFSALRVQRYCKFSVNANVCTIFLRKRDARVEKIVIAREIFYI